MNEGLPELELFGSAAQREMMRQGVALRQITREDPRFSFYGRHVSLTSLCTNAISLVSSLAQLQGASSCIYVPKQEADNFCLSLNQLGFVTDRFEVWRGGETALEASRTIIAQRQIPPDLEVLTIGADTPGSVMAALDEVTSSCGVLLPFGDVMRGIDTQSVCLLAMDGCGKPVASAASVAFNHPESAHGEDAWWGMLATREDRRGEGIAIFLGAMAMSLMNKRYGYSSFSTGVRTGNTASERLCQYLGLSAGSYCAVGALVPDRFKDGRMTR